MTVTCEAEALRLAVEVVAPHEPDHEVQVQFLFPVPVHSDVAREGGPKPSPGFTHTFWATDGRRLQQLHSLKRAVPSCTAPISTCLG